MNYCTCREDGEEKKGVDGEKSSCWDYCLDSFIFFYTIPLLMYTPLLKIGF